MMTYRLVGNSKGMQLRGALNFFQLNIAEEKNLLEVRPVRLKDSKLCYPRLYFSIVLHLLCLHESKINIRILYSN